MRFKLACGMLCWLGGFILAPVQTDAQQKALPPPVREFSVKDLDARHRQSHSQPYGINDAGDVVGWVEAKTTNHNLPEPIIHAFLWRRGRFSDIGTLSGHGASADAINNKGKIAGTTDDGNGGIHGLDPSAILWEKGRSNRLPRLPGYRVSYCNALNNRGEIAGTATTFIPEGGSTDQPERMAFVYQARHLHSLGTLGGRSSSATGINDRREVVGSADTKSGKSHAFLWSRGKMRDLGTLGGFWSEASAINNKGEVVGSSATVKGGIHAFLWRNGVMHDLGKFGPKGGWAASINDADMIVGSLDMSTPHDPGFHACLWQNGKLYDLNSLIPAHSGWILCQARGINQRGQIMGCGLHHGNYDRTFLLTPR